MADGMTVDASEIEALARDINAATGRIVPEMRKSVSKSALNVKRAMQKDFEASTHFRGIARSVTYDMRGNDSYSEAEIGPVPTPGLLENIAYFGGARGGGTVRDPREPLQEESESFFEHIERLATEGVLG